MEQHSPNSRKALSATARALLTLATAALLSAAWFAPAACASGEKLYGVHWWDYNNNGTQVGAGPTGGWSTETVLTHSDPWWQAWFFQHLYQTVATQHNASIITRVDYNWGQTVPAPANPDRANWPGNVLGIANTLGAWSHTWVIGNEPNLIGEGNGWIDNRITPAGYAAVYHDVRAAIKAARPQDEVLIAGPSPGHLIEGVRWMAGNDWLAQTLAGVKAIPGAGVDGVALHAYGNPFATADVAVQEFHNDYASQLSVIDAQGFQDVAVYLTEWNRATSAAGNLAANEQVTADFIRGAMADVNAWNQTPGKHNIVAMTWFVQNGDAGSWPEYSIDHWKTIGNPIGHPGDLSTALLQGGNYPAGLKGTRPQTSGPFIGDFNDDSQVDGTDFLLWQRNTGAAGGSPTGDANADGNVDGADLAIWRDHYGTAAGNLATVPEPQTAALACGALLALFATGRISRQQRRGAQGIRVRQS